MSKQSINIHEKNGMFVGKVINPYSKLIAPGKTQNANSSKGENSHDSRKENQRTRGDPDCEYKDYKYDDQKWYGSSSRGDARRDMGARPYSTQLFLGA